MARNRGTGRLVGTYLVLAILCVAVAVAALLAGQGDLADASLVNTLLELRALRVGAAFLVGASLATAGVVAQGIFRNPLVSPSILGTTAGASLGGQVALLVHALLPATWVGLMGPEMVLPMGCLLGAAVALAIVLAFCRDRGSTLMLLLTGFILSSLFLSLGGFLTSLSLDSWEMGRAVVSFTLGGVGGVGGRQLLAAVPLVVAGIAASWAWGGTLDLLLSGEEEAASLGVDVTRAQRLCVAWLAALTAAAVSVGGNVAFVGLIVPHVLRPIVGVHHRRLIPAAALLGGAFVVTCDIFTRLLPGRSEIPLGVITGLVGAPVFLVLLAKTRRDLAHG